jgi:hypothetical protein
MAPRNNFTVAGVAEGKKLTSLPTGDESAMERVNALFEGSMSEEMYQVSSCSLAFEVKIHLLNRIEPFLCRSLEDSGLDTALYFLLRRLLRSGSLRSMKPHH